ncbi:HK97-gp10 family putative phage morphogenesis protein [Serratia sp. JKS000199]|uniref:HK97-gp10 family putative phage morphogenesis protein n=1 Tax=Serratia sp. JKS000199 TaxID=1938820 RepID=UPI000BB9488A|nr:HK97-gp10 family putative phage morphogenesis protein [Serratia sp. JKS000199]SNY85073.1 phage protein, HK97 gp10 family [Serratia sp. JKS000199]
MISINVTGLDSLERQLKAMGDEAVKVLRDAGRAALEPVLEDMKQHAGFDESSTGPHMRDDIKIRSTSRMNDPRYLTVMTFKVGPSKKHHMKALAQEFGTVKQVALPFIRPALDYNKTRVLRILAAELRYGIENR